MGALLRDATAASIVAALLAFPLLGFQLDASAQGLALNVRLIWVVYAAAAVFAGRLVF
jgi:branched-chain amino acid transport system permease protein